MKKFFLGTLIVFLIAQGCVKSNDECNATESSAVAPATEITNIQNYLSSNSLNATQHPSGFFYSISAPGSGGGISNLCSVVTVAYKGKLANGNTFDSTSVGQSVQFELQTVIIGWQKGMPLLQKGGSIRLYVPPSLGYGAREIRDQSGTLIIPSNSMLIFDVNLLDIANL